jgi:hypothetical protein
MKRTTWLTLCSAALLVACGTDLQQDQGALDTEYAPASVLSMASTMTYAKGAGVACAHLAMAGAIAHAESGLNTNSVGTNGPTAGCPHGSKDLGLWQINNCYHPLTCNAFDPACNAKAMASISSHGTNWGPWSTYHNGAYKKYLAQAQVALGMVAGCH